MLKKVQIAEKNLNKIVVEYTIVLINHATDRDFFNEAWQNAIDEGLVNPNRRLDYEIRDID